MNWQKTGPPWSLPTGWQRSGKQTVFWSSLKTGSPRMGLMKSCFLMKMESLQGSMPISMRQFYITQKNPSLISLDFFY